VLDVFGIDSTASTKMEADGAGQGLVIGVCPIRKGHCVDLGEDDSSYQRYRKIFGAFLACLIRKGYRLAFCHTDITDLPLMYELVDDITRACPGTDVPRRIMQDPIVSTEDLIARIESCDMIVASRFHGVVLPMALQKPVLALSAYGRKIGDVMSQLGQAAYYLEARKADVGHLIKVFQALEQNRHSIAQHLEAVAPDLRSALNKQYDEVLERFKRQSDVTRRRNTAGVPGVYIQDTAPGAPARGACGQAGTNRVSSPAAIGGARA
jgi:hypothetical protein